MTFFLFLSCFFWIPFFKGWLDQILQADDQSGERNQKEIDIHYWFHACSPHPLEQKKAKQISLCRDELTKKIWIRFDLIWFDLRRYKNIKLSSAVAVAEREDKRRRIFEENMEF